ncbi:anchored repeat ABC transporter, substrate-binding protein [Trueperella sp. LYQ143]|uniref:anchored repeat ABC transporter, substrate-binding protein n=1 Tax=unclassified Trueperella TaxID=2630174 RepID=UPI0039835E35
MLSRRIRGIAVIGSLALALSGCASQAIPQRDDGITDVVATTPIIADLARHVAGNRARVTSLMPSGADPHTYEPTLRDVRNIANADLALTNYMLLEEHSLIRAVDANVRDGVPVITLAEDAARYGANLIPLVEDVSLDTIWLGMRVIGNGANLGANRASEVRLSVRDVRGPGDAAAFLTTTFGQPDIMMNSADGFDASDGYESDTATLPVDAHTHLSWSFSEPGIYEMDFAAQLVVDRTEKPIDIAQSTITFAVGVNPPAGKTLLDHGHEDVSVDLNNKSIVLHGDSMESTAAAPASVATSYDPAKTVVVVPSKALQEIPASADFRFLGRPGTQTYMLPQAVLGKHVHGEIDPHLWHDVSNAIAYVKLIRDSLISVDPEGAAEYSANADAYLATLSQLDEEVRATIQSIPPERRHLVTTHDGYAYLGKAYGIDVAGFITPNPAIEPSARDLIALTKTLQNLHVPAVFLEPNLPAHATDLVEIAKRLDIKVCKIYGDAFDSDVNSYEELMRANARSLKECLAP